MKRILFLLFITLFFLIVLNPTKESSLQLSEDNFINSPHFRVDSVQYDDNNLILYLVDSKPMFNPIELSQAIEWYSYQINTDKLNALKLIYRLPNRDESVDTINLNLLVVNNRKKRFSNKMYHDFYKDFNELNVRISNEYSDWGSFLFEVNVMISEEIELLGLSSQFPSNNTIFGINSFDVFYMYFEEKQNKNEGLGHRIINDLRINKANLDPSRNTLFQLINKYG